MAKKTEKNASTSTEEIVIPSLNIIKLKVVIAGEDELVLNKIAERDKEDMLNKQAGRPVNPNPHNEYEDIATSLHWRDPYELPKTQEELDKLFAENVPCIPTFGLNKSFGNTVTRFKLDKNATSWNATVKVVNKDRRVPITYETHYVEETLIPSSTISRVPVRALLHHFGGWKAELEVRIADCKAFNISQVLQCIGYAGFGIGIGAGRSSDYGRYHIESVTR